MPDQKTFPTLKALHDHYAAERAERFKWEKAQKTELWKDKEGQIGVFSCREMNWHWYRRNHDESYTFLWTTDSRRNPVSPIEFPSA